MWHALTWYVKCAVRFLDVQVLFWNLLRVSLREPPPLRSSAILEKFLFITHDFLCAVTAAARTSPQHTFGVFTNEWLAVSIARCSWPQMQRLEKDAFKR